MRTSTCSSHDVAVQVQGPMEVDVDEAMAALEEEDARRSMEQMCEPHNSALSNNATTTTSAGSLRASANHNKLTMEQRRQSKINIMTPASQSQFKSLSGIGTGSNMDSSRMDPSTAANVNVNVNNVDDMTSLSQGPQEGDAQYIMYQPPQQQDGATSITITTLPPILTAAAVPDNDNDNANDGLLDAHVTVVEQNHPRGPKVAHEARLTDFLENRNLQVTLGGVLCLVLVGAVIAAVSIVLTTSNGNGGSKTAVTTIVPTVSPSTSLVPSLSPMTQEMLSSSPSVLTMAPTSLPTSKPLMVNLPDYTIKALQDPKSPQSLAYKWLKQHPQLETLEEWQMHQYMAIVSIYYSTNGPASWPDNDPNKRNVLSYNTSVCDWLPTTTTASGLLEFGPCRNGDNATVTHLTLKGLLGNTMTSHLHGTIPPEVALLSSLEEFRVVESDLVQHELAAFWPLQLSTLPNLRKIEFWANNLQGSLPPAVLTPLGQQQQLTFLSLASNTVLAGGLPTELGLLTSLQYLYLEVNSFTSTIPSEIGNLVQLQALRLYQNELTGTMPDFASRLTHLESLWLERNDLTGTLPPNLCELIPSLAARSRVRLDCAEVPCPSGCNCSCGG
jgi:hypothetical protein